MKKILDYINRLLPLYSIIPLVMVLLINVLTYNGTRIFTQGLEHHDISNAIDNALPFVPEFISIYILAFVQWGIGFVIIARESKELCYRIFAGEIIAKLICFVCFVVYPTTLVRPEITGDGIWNVLTQFIYSVDSADNLFPSIHCLESWVCFRGAIYVKKMPGWYKWATLVMSLAVFASTVLVKQHVVYDMFGAVAAVEFGLYMARRFGLGRLFGLFEIRAAG